VERDKYLIVNADDFGQSDEINRGIICAHEEGIVTSTSFMPCWPAAATAAAYAKRHPELSLGLHVDLGEWACRNGQWYSVYEVLPSHDLATVSRVIEEQLSQYRRLIGADPTHLDSHQHVHRAGAAREVMLELSERLGVPLRLLGPVYYCGDFYGQSEEGASYPAGVSLQALLRIFASLKPGVTEMACHPGAGVPRGSTAYAAERDLELRLLCDPRVRKALAQHGIGLCSFHPRSSGFAPTSSL